MIDYKLGKLVLLDNTTTNMWSQSRFSLASNVGIRQSSMIVEGGTDRIQKP